MESDSTWRAFSPPIGHDVVLVARSEAKLQQLGDELKARHGIAAHVVAADLGQPESPRRLFEWTSARGLAIDVLVNNAGFGVTGKFVETDLKAELEMIQVARFLR